MKLDPNEGDTRPFAQANVDSLNPGVKDRYGNRLPSGYHPHVDDHLYADNAKYFPLAVAASIVSLEDAFGGSHEFQENVLSEEKLHLDYKEIRTVLGYQPNTRTMMVELSPRQREKIIAFIEFHGWTTTKESATIKELAQILGLLQNACFIFPWGLAQLFIVQNLLRDNVTKAFNNAQRNRRLQKLIVDESNKVPSNMSYRLRYLKMAMECRFLWQSKSSIVISKQVCFAIKIIYDFLLSSARWESPIGHLIPRDPFMESQGDASYMCIGVTIPAIKVFVLLPYSKEIRQRIINEELWINALEFGALFLAYITFLADYNLRPNEFPPFPVLRLWGDSKSANKWMRTISSGSYIAQNLLRLFANYLMHSPVKGDTEFVAGELNKEADDISRVQELFSPQKTQIYDVPYITLLKQVCLKHKEKRSWRVFHPSAQILSDLSCVLLSNYVTEVPKKTKNLGQFYPVESTFYGTAGSETSYPSSFL